MHLKEKMAKGKDSEIEEREKLAAAPGLSDEERAAIRSSKLTGIDLARWMSANPAKTRDAVTAATANAVRAQAAYNSLGLTNYSGRGDELDRAAEVGQYSPNAKRGVVNRGVEQIFGGPVAR